MKVIFSIFIFFLSVMSCYSQFTPEKDRIELVTLGAGAGFSSFIGDMGSKGDATLLANVRSMFYANFERRFGKVLGAQLNVDFGKLSYNERANEVLNNRNFESNTMQIGANLVLHFDNDVIFKREIPFAPYVSAGFHYLTFDSYSDLKDENGTAYQYWSDGTINDISEDKKDALASTIIYRDYEYETQLKDSTVNYKRSSFAIPLTLGLKWKITPRFNGRVFGTYNIILSDWVDNISENGDNDKNINVGFGLHYVLKIKDKERRHLYDDVDFEAMSSSDSDKDGIGDATDRCQNTPNGIEVNGFGCPLDKDKDGVADYLDKEEDTKKGAIVDEEGRTLTDEMLAKRQEEKIALVTERNTSFSEEASGATLDKIFEEIQTSDYEGGKIPSHLAEADTNNDGLISPKEVSDAMDTFFDGNSSLSVAGIHELIDYFFEQ